MASISVSGIGKAYKHYASQWARLCEWLDWRHVPRHTTHWVLKDISFSVQAGEAVGIIGMNGAGKSTLLKILTGTTRPTAGEVSLHGRVAALLELGMGFHPDFTGRQNVIMASQLLGFSVEETQAIMPDIEAFAGIGHYIDLPVRVYSSGMQVRLAFSVATARRPDILIVDEALSVGDVYFQNTCMERIRSFREQGTTLLLVSHDRLAIQSLCDRALLLRDGQLAMSGTPEQVMDYYNALLADHKAEHIRQVQHDSGEAQTVSGTGEVIIEVAELLNDQAVPIDLVSVGQAISLHVRVNALQAVPQLTLGYMIKDRLGQPVFGTNTHHMRCAELTVRAGQRIDFNFDFVAQLGEGKYSIAIALHHEDSHMSTNYEWRDMAVIFEVINQHHNTFVGTAWLPSVARVSRHEC